MQPCPSILIALILAFVFPNPSFGYSPREDALAIREFKREQGLNHAKIARDLVHRANWAALGSLSTNKLVEGYPMVNIISIDDSDANGNSTGRIRFLLTDLDFTGPDWQKDNKVTLLFSDEQTLRCKDGGKDPMEPTCARSMISGQVQKVCINLIVSYFLCKHYSTPIFSWIPVTKAISPQRMLLLDVIQLLIIGLKVSLKLSKSNIDCREVRVYSFANLLIFIFPQPTISTFVNWKLVISLCWTFTEVPIMSRLQTITLFQNEVLLQK